MATSKSPARGRPRNATRPTAPNVAERRTRQTPQAAALRAHGHRNDTADMMKTVAHADGSHRAPTNSTQPAKKHHTVPASARVGSGVAGASHSQKGIATPKLHGTGQKRAEQRTRSAAQPKAPHHTVPASPRGTPEGTNRSQRGIATPKAHRTPAATRPQAQVQTSASGARYVMTPSGKKRYLGKKAR